jgi:hypothetical protein
MANTSTWVKLSIWLENEIYKLESQKFLTTEDAERLEILIEVRDKGMKFNRA